MCGITAVVKKSNVEFKSQLFGQMNEDIIHRGPDGEGTIFFWNERTEGWKETFDSSKWNVAIGHRYLSINNNTDTGKQLMSYDDSIWISCNGEVYNYLELKNELISKGYVFKTNSDTEVILVAYRAWGIECFSRFRGMWGLVIFDSQRNKLIACRDRIGIKPIYYTIKKDIIAFFSEQKQAKHIPGFEATPNYSVVKEYLYSGFERTDRTFFNEIHPVLPGTYMEVDIDSLSVSSPVSYWNPERIKISVFDRNDAAQIFKEEFLDSVSVHLRSDESVGCELNSGLDSSSVMVTMSALLEGKSTIHSFTSTFFEKNKYEKIFVNEIVNKVKAKNHLVTPTSEGFLEDLRNFTWIHDEPVGSLSIYANYDLARFISRNNIRVVLNGLGGDEILGGYWQTYFSYLLGKLQHGNMFKALSHVIGAGLPSGNFDLIKRVPTILQRYTKRKNSSAILPFKNVNIRDSENISYLSDYVQMSEGQRRIFDIRKLILPRLLKWNDRNLMAFSIEGKYPMLDHKLIEACLMFSPDVLYNNGWTKQPLRDGMRDMLPQKIIQRTATFGLESTQEKWFKNEYSFYFDKWLRRDNPVFELIDKEEVAGVLGRYRARNINEDGQMLFRIFMLNQWMDVFNVKIS